MKFYILTAALLFAAAYATSRRAVARLLDGGPERWGK